MPKIAQRHIRSWRVLAPPLQEQRGIVEAIEDVAKNINKAVKQAQAEITLIREYRIRLIADVVTGKLDVRGVELPQSDEPAVLGDFDDGEDVDDLSEDTDEVEVIEGEDAG